MNQESKAIMKLHPSSTIKSAATRHGSPIPIYDDGDGEVYIHRDSMGINGVVRSSNWEDAYSICEDEFFPEAPAWDEIMSDFPDETEATILDNVLWQESYGYRPNGQRHGDKHGHGIYAKDLNGDCLDVLTDVLLDQLDLTIEVETDWESIFQDVMNLEMTDAVGQYIPQAFAESITPEQFAAQPFQVQTALTELMREDSHEKEYYWDDWITVLDRYADGPLRLHQNGDLWVYDSDAFSALTDYHGITDDDAAFNIFGG